MILTLNAGSSSLKFALFDGQVARFRGEVESIDDGPAAVIKDGNGHDVEAPAFEGTGHEAVLPALFAWAEEHGEIGAVGHRIVHGGDRAGPARVDDALLEELDALTPLAPLHQPHNLAAIRLVARTRPGVPQVASFDTAFHATLPPLARMFALPASLGFRRYGFHGLSFEWIAGRLPARLAAGRVIVAHLGSGASLCALHRGRSIETTMGATPLDGLVMGTRCGSLDPGVVLAMARQIGVDAAERALYHDAGLKGVSGGVSDMRSLHEHHARETIALFCYRAAALAGAMAVALQGVDGLVFTGGIGENDAAVRNDIAGRLAWLGPMEVLTIPTDEEAVIARQTDSLIAHDHA